MRQWTGSALAHVMAYRLFGAKPLHEPHDDVIKWKHFPRNWPFVRGIHRSRGEFPTQRPVTRSFDVFFHLRLDKRLNKQSRCWWFETLSGPLWRHGNECWLIVNWTNGDKFQSHSHRDSSIYIREHAFEHVVRKIAATFVSALMC